MTDQYLYSASRVKALEGKGAHLSALLLDRMIEAPSEEAFRSVVEDSYLAPFVDLSPDNLDAAIVASILEAKILIESIAPDREPFAILFARYDVENLGVALKGLGAEHSEEHMLSLMSSLGNIAPSRLLIIVQKDEKGVLPLELERGLAAARRAETPSSIDMALSLSYLDYFGRLLKSRERVWRDYHNLVRAYLVLCYELRRSALLDMIAVPPIASCEGQAIADFVSLLSSKRASEVSPAILRAKEDGEYKSLEIFFANELIEYLRRESQNELFSAATLLGYLEARREDGRRIRGIAIKKLTGESPKETEAYFGNLLTYVR